MRELLVGCGNSREKRVKYGKHIPIWPGFDFIHGGYKGTLSEYLERMNPRDETTSSAA